MTFSSEDISYMQRCLDLAHNGIGRVSPNPVVGAVIVHQGKIIGEGWHEKAGSPHAEVNAVCSVKNQHLLADSVIYVSLEPCSHFGKTPPCADLLIEKRFKKVVIATLDPNPQVAGRGIAKLRDAGIEVVSGVLEKEAIQLNKRFFCMMQKNRPYIILKWAQTANGKIARSNFDSKWISNLQSRQLVHQLRATEDAILVGKNTALNDDPALNTRLVKGKNPIRIVIDHQLQLPQHLQLFDQSQITLVYNLKKSKQDGNVHYVMCSPGNFLEDLLDDLFQRSISSLIVEGGAKTLQQFIDQAYWDEAWIFNSSAIFEKGIGRPNLKNAVNYESKSLSHDQLDMAVHERNAWLFHKISS